MLQASSVTARITAPRLLAVVGAAAAAGWRFVHHPLHFIVSAAGAVVPVVALGLGLVSQIASYGILLIGVGAILVLFFVLGFSALLFVCISGPKAVQCECCRARRWQVG